MTVDEANVLVVGEDGRRVELLSHWLADTVNITPLVSCVLDGLSVANVDVVLLADAAPAPKIVTELPADTRTIVVLEEPVDRDQWNDGPYDHVLVEPLNPEQLRETVRSVLRQVRYDRRLRECAKLAAELGRAKITARAEPVDNSIHLRREVASTKAELDDMVAEFTDDDFRHAFQTITAD